MSSGSSCLQSGGIKKCWSLVCFTDEETVVRVSEVVEVIIANRMVLNETMFRSRSSEKVMSIINEENFTAFILTRELYSKKACIQYLITFFRKIVSPICNSRMGECPVHLKVPEQKIRCHLPLLLLTLSS